MIGDKPQKIIPPSKNVGLEYMQKLFMQTEQRLIAEITRKRNQGYVDYAEHATLRRVQQILRDMVDESEQYVPKLVSYPFLTGKGTFKGYASAEEIIQRTDEETRRLIEQLSDNLLGEITEAAATVYQSSANMIAAQNALKAAENGIPAIGRLHPDIYRKNVLAGVISTTATGAGPLRSVEAVVKQLEQEGLPAFIDRAGRKWSLRDYGNMATRTTFRQAQTAAELSKDDHDLYEVLRHPAPCRVCAIYSGRVYSKSGTNPNYPSLAQAFGKVDPAGPDVLSNTYLNIHPSCLCTITRYTEKGKTDEQIQRMRDKSSFEKNPPKGDPRTKKEIEAYRQKEKNRRILRDEIKEWEKMREALGDKVPATFATFQKHKRLNDDKYKAWKDLMRGQNPPKPSKAPKPPKPPTAPTAPKPPTAKAATAIGKASSIEEANSAGTNIIRQAYENHRIENNTRSVPLAEMPDNVKILNANYGKMSVETANEFNSTLSGLINDFDTPLQEVRVMTSAEHLAAQDAFAFVRHNYSSDGAIMVINPIKCKNIEDLKKRIADLSDAGYCIKIDDVQKAGQYVATHEFAHTILNLHDSLSDKRNFVGADYAKVRSARKEIERIYSRYMKEVEQLTKTAKDVELQVILETDIEKTKQLEKAYFEADAALSAKKLSDYSLVNVDEFMAEAFTNERIGSQSNPYGREVMEVVKKYFGRR